MIGFCSHSQSVPNQCSKIKQKSSNQVKIKQCFEARNTQLLVQVVFIQYMYAEVILLTIQETIGERIWCQFGVRALIFSKNVGTTHQIRFGTSELIKKRAKFLGVLVKTLKAVLEVSNEILQDVLLRFLVRSYKFSNALTTVIAVENDIKIFPNLDKEGQELPLRLNFGLLRSVSLIRTIA